MLAYSFSLKELVMLAPITIAADNTKYGIKRQKDYLTIAAKGAGILKLSQLFR